MTFPRLPDWNMTRIGLHQASQVIGAIRASVAEPEPNWTHLGLRVTPQGLTTGRLPEVGEFLLDFKTLSVVHQPLSGDGAGFSLIRQNQTSLADAIMGLLRDQGHTFDLKREKIQHTDLFELDPAVAATYADALAALEAVFASFRASLSGETSPLIVWPHGFDLSFLWFATDKADENEPHMSFGFSPYSAGFDRPYVYAYLYPVPEGLTEHALPPLARWTSDSWTGVVIEYDDLVRQNAPETLLASLLRQLHESLSSMVG